MKVATATRIQKRIPDVTTAAQQMCRQDEHDEARHHRGNKPLQQAAKAERKENSLTDEADDRALSKGLE